MPQTQHEWITQLAPELTEDVIVSIVEAEKWILEKAANQNRTFPYILTLEDSKAKLASEEVFDSDRREAIISGQRIDGPSWNFTNLAKYGPSAENLTIKLTSGIEPLIRQLCVAEPNSAGLREALKDKEKVR